jgi:NAD(P)-dependent dehydrogenase (short-subunit alcohol dehydrogenase family)
MKNYSVKELFSRILGIAAKNRKESRASKGRPESCLKGSETSMKIVLVGASGTLGKAIALELAPRHEILAVGRKSGDYQADLREIKSLESLFQKTGRVDAIVCAAGTAYFGSWSELTPEKFEIGLRDKLLGQVNAVLAGQKTLNDGGSFTLTSGILSQDPIQNGAALSMVNGALESFVRAAAIELPRGLRINVVSPTVLEESMGSYGPYFRGYQPVPASRAALAYSKSVEGRQTGQIYKVW